MNSKIGDCVRIVVHLETVHFVVRLVWTDVLSIEIRLNFVRILGPHKVHFCFVGSFVGVLVQVAAYFGAGGADFDVDMAIVSQK